MSVVVQTAVASLSKTCPFTIALATPVVVGNIIVVYLGGSSDNYPNPERNPRDISFTDNLGNTYHKGVVSDDSNLFVAGWYAYVTTGGACTLSAASSGITPINMSAVASEILGAGRRFIDGQCQMGRYFSTLPEGAAPLGGILNPRGFDTGPIPIAGDTVILTGFFRPRNYSYQIDSGDTLVAFDTTAPPGGTPWLGVFENSLTGAGSTARQIQIQSNVAQGPVEGLIGAMYFSKPLARPGGTTAQYGVTPGRGFGDGSLPSPSTGWDQDGVFQSQRTVRVPLPYYPVMGSLVYFILAQNVLTEGAGYTFTVSDDYGNVWAPIPGAIEAGHGATVKGFYTYLTALPTAGQNFIAKFTVTGPFTAATVYQTPGAFVVEHSNITGAAVPTGTGTLSKTGTAPATTITTNALACATPAVLTAVAFLPDTSLWTALESYTIRSQWNVGQIPDPDTANNGKMACLALEDKIVSPGTYDAQIISNRDGAYGMILIATPIVTLAVACPVGGGTGTVGVPYSKQIIASGGTPPYTYAITSGALPPGLILNPLTGVISGTPLLTGTYSYTVTATDANGATQTATCAVVVIECTVTPFQIHQLRFRMRPVGEYIDGTIGEYYESPEFNVQPGRVGELKDFLLDYDVSGAGGRLELYTDKPSNALAIRRTLAIPAQPTRGIYVFPLESAVDTTTDSLPAGQLFKVRLYPPPGGILRLHGRAIFRARIIGVYFVGGNGEIWETQPVDLFGGMAIYRQITVVAQTAGPMLFEMFSELPGQDIRVVASFTLDPSSSTPGRLPVYARLPGSTKGRLQKFRISGAHETRIFEVKILGRRLEVNGSAWDWASAPLEATPDEWAQIQMPVRDTPEAFDWIDVPVDGIM